MYQVGNYLDNVMFAVEVVTVDVPEADRSAHDGRQMVESSQMSKKKWRNGMDNISYTYQTVP